MALLQAARENHRLHRRTDESEDVWSEVDSADTVQLSDGIAALRTAEQMATHSLTPLRRKWKRIFPPDCSNFTSCSII